MVLAPHSWRPRPPRDCRFDRAGVAVNHHSADEVAHQFESIRRRIDAVERPWTDAVEITAVTKAFAPTVVDTAVEAGCTVIGENYAQDLLSKRAAIECLVPHRRPRVDFIGHLQSNKVRQLVGLVDRWCTIDRSSIAKEIANRAPGSRGFTSGQRHRRGEQGGMSA